MLDFFPNADHAALYSAIAHGDFSAVGLDVKPQTPADPSEPLKLLAAGKADMAISYEPELLLARDEGLKLVSVGALVQRPLTSIIALPAGPRAARSPTSLARRVGTAGIPYQAAELKTARADRRRGSGERQGSQRRLQPRAGDALEQSRRDARRLLELRGDPAAADAQASARDPGRPRRACRRYNELVLVVREDEAHTRGQDLRAFMQALTRGEREVRADPAAAAALVVKANPSLQQKLQLASIEQTLPGRRAGRGQALRLADPVGVGVVRKLDVRPRAAQAQPEFGAAAVHQRVPAGPGHLGGEPSARRAFRLSRCASDC